MFIHANPSKSLSIPLTKNIVEHDIPSLHSATVNGYISTEIFQECLLHLRSSVDHDEDIILLLDNLACHRELEMVIYGLQLGLKGGGRGMGMRSE